MNARRAVAALGLLLAAGCAVPPMTSLPPAPRAARDTSTAGTVAPTGHPALPAAVTPRAAMVDSTPSPAALAVLSTIPEPLAPGERVPPPGPAPAIPPTPAPAPAPASPDSGLSPPPDTLSAAERAQADSLIASPPDTGAAAANGDTTSIPIPSPTPVLGDRPPAAASDSSAAASDTSGAAAPPANPPAPVQAPSAPPAAGKAPARGTVPASGTCWRLQLVAPRDRATAVKKRAAAESLLLLPMVIEHEAGLWKIRSKDCFDRATADRLKGRAVASGFAGAFPFSGHR